MGITDAGAYRGDGDDNGDDDDGGGDGDDRAVGRSRGSESSVRRDEITILLLRGRDRERGALFTTASPETLTRRAICILSACIAWRDRS